MKKIILFTLIAGISYFIFSSYSTGPGTNSYDCSGADVNSGSGNPLGCTTCHGSTATTGITFTIEIDSAGTPVSITPATGHYTPGYTYTIKITGTNTTATSLPMWGFQVAATVGAVAATSPVNAGVLQTTGLPAGIHYLAAPGTTATFFANVVEHSARLSPTSGTGGAGTVYSTSFTWTAPAAGTGVVSIFGALNAVNNNGSADAGDKWNTAQLVLNELVPPAIAPISGSFSICVGSSTTLTDATTPGTWTSGTTSVATIVSSTGVLTGVAAGTSIITYTTSLGSVTQVITVNPTPTAGTITGSATVCQGATTPLTDATAGGSWTSGTTAIATVGATGIVSGVAAGTAVISYTVTNPCGTATATYTVTVLPLPTVGAITGTGEFCAGTTTPLTDGTAGGTWSSSNPGVATVGATGVVTGVAGGTANISYIVTNSCGSVHATKTVTVDVLAAGSISGSSAICLGTSTTYTDATTGGVWSSSNVAVASIGSATGVATGVSTGTATITYSVTNTCGTATAIFTVSVISTPTVAPISGSNSLCQLTTISLTDATTGGTWSSSNTAIASIGTTGIVTGIAGGTVNITYTVTYSCGTVFAIYPITVNPLPAVAAITGTAEFCLGSTTALSDVTPGGTWSSTNTAVATIGSAGLVSSVSAGTATIHYVVTNFCGSTTVSKTVTVDVLPASLTITGPSLVCETGTITLTDAASGSSWSSSNTTVATVGSATGIVSGMLPGVATITGSLTNTCGTISATHTVTVNPLPNAGTISGVSSLCIGSLNQLYENVPGGTWSSSNTSVATITIGTGYVTGVSAGTTIITYTATSACGNSYTTHAMTIDTIPVPTITVSGNIFTSTYVYPAYEWMLNGSILIGATYRSYAANTIGNYVLVVTDANGCTGSSATYDFTNTAVKNIGTAANIRIYPNPTQSVVFIESSEKVDVTLSNIEGRILSRVNQATEVDLSTLPDGTYYITIFDHNSGYKVGTQKILKAGK